MMMAYMIGQACVQFSPLGPSSTSFDSSAASGRPKQKKEGIKGAGESRVKINKTIKLIALGVLTLFICLMAQWGLNQYKLNTGQKAAPMNDLQSAEGTDAGIIQQLFCPIIDLPAFQGMLTDNE